MNKIVNIPNFTLNFKKYKSKDFDLNYDDLICFNQESSKIYSQYNLSEPNMECPPGILPVRDWKSYYLNDHPGLIIISNLLSKTFQKFIIMRCFENYICEPNKTNLDMSSKNVEELWNEYKKDPVKGSKDIKKLRWATMGFHHNWDTKVYNLTEQTAMPKEIKDCCKYIACAAGYDNYNAEASIVNFYHVGNTLSGHTDHSEEDQKSPIISISFGCSAIFMIGGESKEDKCSAILIKNGDVVIMSQQSRLCYHAVPRILTGTYELNELKTLPLNANENTLKINENLFTTESNCFPIDKDKLPFKYKTNIYNDTNKIKECILSNEKNKCSILLTETKYSQPINVKSNESPKYISNEIMHSTNSNVSLENLTKLNEAAESNLQYIPNLNAKDYLMNVSNPNIKRELLSEISLEDLINYYIISNETNHENEDNRIKRFKFEKCNDTNSLLNILKYDWNIYHNFLLNARININVRQVKLN